MGDPADPPPSVREMIERILLAGIGAVTLTRERAEELAEELASRGSLSRTETRQAIDDVMARWRGDAARLGEKAGASFGSAFREVGLVTRHEYEELELRLAQLEHRLRLVEQGSAPRDEPLGGGPRPVVDPRRS